MVQQSFVGLFFFIGLMAGLIMTTILANFGILDFLIEPGRRRNIMITGQSGTPSVQFRPPMSHEELENMESSHVDAPVNFTDGHFHHDKDNTAKELFNKVPVLCWVMTAEQNLKKKAVHVKATWGKRCNKLIFMSDTENKQFPAVKVDAPAGYEHLTARTMKAFEYIYKNHINDADWFLKVDDDTFVIVENLRYMLSTHSPTDPVFFGHAFKMFMKQGYFSGGGGYVISKEALIRFGKRDQYLCSKDGGAEDVEFGRCMEKLGVVAGDSRDALGRSRFHCFNPETHLQGGYPQWYYQYDKYGARKGPDSMSDYPITFHYMGPDQMYNLEYYVYHLRPYGIESGHQDLNVAPNQADKQTEKSKKKSKSIKDINKILGS